MFSYQLCQGRQLLASHVQAQVHSRLRIALRAVLLPAYGATYLIMLGRYEVVILRVANQQP
jgi:hypothetical protein